MKMPDSFTKTICINNHVLDFGFYCLYRSAGKKYFVSARNGQEYRAFHIVQDNSGKWLLAGDVPSWAGEVEKQLCRFADGVN